MTDAGYRDIQPEAIPVIERDGASLKLIAGRLLLDGVEHLGAELGGATRPLYADVHLAPGAELTLPVASELSGMLYLYEGEASLAGQNLRRSAASELGDGDRVELAAGKQGARLLLIAGKPIGEPIVQYGPFVMNTREEIEQALQDYRDGRLTA